MIRNRTIARAALLAVAILALPQAASANKVGWLEDVVHRVVKASDPELARSGRVSGRLFEESAEQGLSSLARRSDAIALAGKPADEVADAALDLRFNRMVGQADPELSRTFRALAPAEKRLVLRMGEAAERISRRFPDRAPEMIRKLGVEGMTAVRVYGDDVAEVIVREGPEAVNVLRKSGRSGWEFYVGTVLRHKRKLAAAGVLGLFLADPDRFVDSAGRITEYAVAKFAEAGIDLAGAVGSGAARGLERSLADRLGVLGLGGAVLKWTALIAAGIVAAAAFLVILGLPVRWLTLPFRMVGRGLRATVRSS
ncbi:hypothetical protein [Tautonia sociabilis]|uniref:hypothetical protein n=1 Tax=Tautonia sociabilis TaxID=2080755 RepID=UPI0013156F59|nr:hypothetical protein [Tautonia sociabilis]